VHLIVFLIFGLIVGVIAKLLVPGREPGGWIASILLGIGGSYLGGFLGRALGLYGPDRSTGGFVLSVIGAVILVAIYHALASRRSV
jgi:uncharacterized membrane protein YeaQ/YmgE (transglycosylase-associated protein family)